MYGYGGAWLASSVNATQRALAGAGTGGDGNTGGSNNVGGSSTAGGTNSGGTATVGGSSNAGGATASGGLANVGGAVGVGGSGTGAAAPNEVPGSGAANGDESEDAAGCGCHSVTSAPSGITWALAGLFASLVCLRRRLRAESN